MYFTIEDIISPTAGSISEVYQRLGPKFGTKMIKSFCPYLPWYFEEVKKCEIFDFIHIWVDIVSKVSNTSEIYNILSTEYDPVRARNAEIHPGEEGL